MPLIDRSSVQMASLSPCCVRPARTRGRRFDMKCLTAAHRKRCIPEEAGNIWLSSRKFSLEGEVCNVAYSQVVEFGLCFSWAKKFMQVMRVFEDTEPI